MSVTSISIQNKLQIWVKAGGRCQYEGCNKSLSEDIVTKNNYNQAYIAHIVADVPGGPRGCAVRSPQLGDDITNLMLLCDAHHRLIDRVDVAGHPESRLLEMKRIHEERIYRITGIAPNMHSHIVIYKANIGNNSPVLTYESVKGYLSPTHFPAVNSAIDLSLTNSPQRDRDAVFWATECQIMDQHFQERIKPAIQRQEISHISLFALAPIPLLIRLGVLMNDIQRMEVHQPIRTPNTWRLSDDNTSIAYKTELAAEKHPVVALNVSLSASIDSTRIKAVLGDHVSIYTISIDKPFNDFLQTKVQLQEFSAVVRRLLNDIKCIHGADSPIHVFPAMPVATAIELGRIWMPKADMPLIVYDQNTAVGGFAEAIRIENK